MWRGDHTVWKPDPTEISNRLGWLTVADQMGEQAAALEEFANEVRSSGYTHVVLLGMGGSSLGPEVLGRTLLGVNQGFPRLIVLDSTVPDRVSTVSREIDPAKTLFLVSSKSGGTVETLSFYRYFRNLVDELLGRREAGRNFVAITDSGTPLESLALEEEFRKVYANPADIGGRYSVLSYFGLLPAALIGMSITRLLDRAVSTAAECSSGVPMEENPGARARGGHGGLRPGRAGQADPGRLRIRRRLWVVGGTTHRGEPRQGRQGRYPGHGGAAGPGRTVRPRPLVCVSEGRMG